MCFYDQYRYVCGDWKWGNFRQHCNKEYRTGETCGTMLICDTLPLAGSCTQCEKIERKERRLRKAESDYVRWSREPHLYKASMEKAARDIQALRMEIAQLRAEKDKRYANICNRRRAAPAYA